MKQSTAILSLVFLTIAAVTAWPVSAAAEEIALFPGRINGEPAMKTSLPAEPGLKDITTLPKQYSFQAMVSFDAASLTPDTGGGLFPPELTSASVLAEQDVYKGMIGVEFFVRSNNDDNGRSFVSYTTGDVVSTERHIYVQQGAGVRYMFPNLKVLFPYVSLRWVHEAVNVRLHDPYEAISVASETDGIAPVMGVDIHARKTVPGIRPFFNFNMEIGYSYLPTMSMGMLGTMNLSSLWFDIGIGLLLQ